MSELEKKKAPNFKLKDQNNQLVSLKDFKGKYVLLYFYPKDMTPGCTVEAKCFRDQLSEFKKKDVQVIGISVDNVESH